MSIKRTANIHQGRHVIRHYSNKANAALVLESFLELYVATTLENDNNVKVYASQPESMNIQIDDKKQRYTPDFLVMYEDNTAEYLEVHNSHHTDDSYREKIKQFSEYSVKFTGVPIRLFTLAKLDRVELSNLLLIQTNAKYFKFPKSYHWPTTVYFGELINLVKLDYNRDVSAVYYLLTIGIYKANLQEKVTINTTLTRCAQL